MPSRKPAFPPPANKGKTFQGSPCRYGHRGLRYVSTGACVTCAKGKRSAGRKDGPSKRDLAEGLCLPTHGRALLIAQGGRCAYCGDDRRLHLDHRISIAHGGSHWPSNRQWLCQGHNLAKHARSDGKMRALLGIKGPSVWDAPKEIVAMIDLDARAIALGGLASSRQRMPAGLTPEQKERRKAAFDLGRRRRVDVEMMARRMLEQFPRYQPVFKKDPHLAEFWATVRPSVKTALPCDLWAIALLD